jgi:protein gp37
VAENSAIEWTHHTFNPWRGCAKVHAGCTHCYAEKNPGVAMQGITWGEVWQGGARAVKAESGWHEPLKWTRDAARVGERHQVFCASLADVLEVPLLPPTGISSADAVTFGPKVREVRQRLDGARERLWDVIRATHLRCGSCGKVRFHRAFHPGFSDWLARAHNRGEVCPATSGGCLHTADGGLDWLLLTKRPENWRLVPEDVRPLVWLGTSISDQKTADEWVARLLDSQGFRMRFLSVEPLTGPVTLRGLLMDSRIPEPARCACGHGHGFTRCPNTGGVSERCHYGGCPCPGFRKALGTRTGIHWVIVGGESGPKARPCNVEWVRSVVRQCRDAGVPCFVKQLGARAVDERDGLVGASLEVPQEAPALVCRRLLSPKGGDMAEWPEDLRVRELPGVHRA